MPGNKKAPPSPRPIKPLSKKGPPRDHTIRSKSSSRGPHLTRALQGSNILKSPGLEYLAQLEYLFVKQQVAPIEITTNLNVANCYNIFNVRGEMVYFGKEESDFVDRNYRVGSYKFEMTIWNSAGIPIMHLIKPYQFNCCWANKGVMHVYAPADKLAGSIFHTGTSCRPDFYITNAKGDKIYEIKGPCIFSDCCGKDIEFPVYDVNQKDPQKPIGKISKQWAGFLQENNTNADNYGVSFPLELSIEHKSLFLAACILTDYLFFEESHVKRDDSRHRRH